MKLKKNTNLSIALLITLVPFILIASFIFVNSQKSPQNSFISSYDYSRLNKEEIDQQLQQDFTLPENLKISLDDKNYIFPLASISASINYQKTNNSLLNYYLERGVFSFIKDFFKNPKKEFNLSIDYDQQLLDQQIENLSQEVNKPFIPTDIKLENKQIVITPGILGLELDQNLLKDQIISQLTLAKFDQNLKIPTNVIGFIPDQQKIDQVEDQAQKLIYKQIVLKHQFEEIIINDQTLVTWLSFDKDYNYQQINDYVANLAQSLKKDPVNAVFIFENDQVTEFQADQPGVIVQESELSLSLQASLQQLLDTQDKSLDLQVPVQSIDPIIKNEDVNNLGIKELLGRGTSTFRHSSSIRNQNIAKGSSIVNRILVAPGQKFSFIQSLGEVSLAAGYKKAYIIRQGRTELDVGGGICQVSTTLFRAMLDAGVDIIERKAHAYRVSYYEEDSKPGFDATVFIPKPDLSFINDTPNHLLIQSIFDLDNRRLTYEIYGTSDGRQSEITNYRQWGASAPPPDVWIDDPTLEPGKVVQDEQAIPGLKTAFDWTVTGKDGNVLHQKTFQSNFTPWAAVYRRGI